MFCCLVIRMFTEENIPHASTCTCNIPDNFPILAVIHLVDYKIPITINY